MFWFYLFIFFVLGLSLGSFAYCLVFRLHHNLSLSRPSFCPHCQYSLSWYDNIPLFSFLFLGGKCRKCRGEIGAGHFLTELIFGLLFAAYFYFSVFSAESWWQLAVGLLALVLWLIVLLSDYYFLEIYLPPLIIAGALILVLQLAAGVSLLSLLLALIIGAGFFALQYLITRGRGIGSGDIWLGGLMGLVFPSWPLLLVAIFISYIFGTLVSLILLAFGRKNLKSRLPLGVFLALGSLVALFAGSSLLSWYLGFLG